MEGVGCGVAGGGGYMSDGDIVRTACRDDANCGYMSEGGVSMYMKRMQQRFREGMLAVRESLEKNNGLTDDDRCPPSHSLCLSLFQLCRCQV